MVPIDQRNERYDAFATLVRRSAMLGKSLLFWYFP